jgi:hypothetical protein
MVEDGTTKGPVVATKFKEPKSDDEPGRHEGDGDGEG